MRRIFSRPRCCPPPPGQAVTRPFRNYLKSWNNKKPVSRLSVTCAFRKLFALVCKSKGWGRLLIYSNQKKLFPLAFFAKYHILGTTFITRTQCQSQNETSLHHPKPARNSVRMQTLQYTDLLPKWLRFHSSPTFLAVEKIFSLAYFPMLATVVNEKQN